MKKILAFSLCIALAAFMSSCAITEINLGDIKADIEGDSFNALAATGVVQKVNTAQSKNLTITGTNGTKVITLNLTEVGTDTLTNCLAVANYSNTTPTSNAVLAYTADGETYSDVVSCTAAITACDETEKLVSGTFEGVVVSTTGDTLEITGGTFTDVSFIVN